MLVAMDLTHMDRLLVQYVSFLANALPGLEKVTFFHNIRFDFPEQVAEILQNLEQPLEEKLAEKIEELADEYLDGLDCEIEVTREDNTVEAMLELQKTNEFDLIMLGKKVSYEGSGYLVERLLHRDLKVNILVLSESAYHRIANILVPIDFSKRSAAALKKAVQVAERAGAKLSCQHVYNIPGIYFPYIPVKDLRVQMEEDARKSWAKFLKKYPQTGQAEDVAFSFQAERTTAQTIYDHALTRQTDLIAVPVGQMPMQSTAIHLLKLDMHIPLLLVKE